MSSSSGWSPFLSSSPGDAEENDYWLAREIEMLERALAEHGDTARRDLGRLIGSRYWGPGRFARALRAAAQQGRISHPRRGVYGPV